MYIRSKFCLGNVEFDSVQLSAGLFSWYRWLKIVFTAISSGASTLTQTLVNTQMTTSNFKLSVRGKSHERVPAGSDHFLFLTDLSQSVASFPCVRKWEHIKMVCASIAWDWALWLWSRRISTRKQKASVVRRECKVAGPWTSGASPIVPFVFSGRPQGLQAGTE